MFKKFLKKITGDEFEKFNYSSLAISTGVSVFYYENNNQSVLEFHDPFQDLVDVFFISNKEAAIETLKRIEKNMKKENENDRFTSILDKTKAAINQFIIRKCYTGIPFLVIQNAKKFGSNKKKRDEYFNHLDKQFNEYLYDN